MTFKQLTKPAKHIIYMVLLHTHAQKWLSRISKNLQNTYNKIKKSNICKYHLAMKTYSITTPSFWWREEEEEETSKWRCPI